MSTKPKPSASTSSLRTLLVLGFLPIVALASCGTSIDGRITRLDGEGLSDAWVLLSSVSSDTGEIAPLESTYSGRNGYYSFSLTEPGNYLIDALDTDGLDFEPEAMKKLIASGAVTPDYDSGRRFLRLKEMGKGLASNSNSLNIQVGTSAKGGVHVTGQLNGKRPEMGLPYELYVDFDSWTASSLVRRSTVPNESGEFDFGYLPESVSSISVEDLFGFGPVQVDLGGQSELEVTIDLPYHSVVRLVNATGGENAWLHVKPVGPDPRFQNATSRPEVALRLVEGEYLASIYLFNDGHFRIIEDDNDPAVMTTTAFSVSPTEELTLLELEY